MTAGRCVNTKSQSWCTPHKYAEAVRRFFGGVIDLDPCSNEFSVVHAATEFILPEKDGLAEEWNYGRIYVNPPYGIDRKSHTGIRDWLKKCSDAHEILHSEVLALIPVAPNTSHWKKYVFTKASLICFLADTRLRFLENGADTGKGAPMACAMVYWGGRLDEFRKIFSEYGAIADITALLT